jgi:hypothetical protein
MVIQSVNLHFARKNIISLEARVNSLELKMEFYSQITEKHLEELTKHITSVEWSRPSPNPRLTIEPWLQNNLVSMQKRILELEKFRLKMESGYGSSIDFLSDSGCNSLLSRDLYPYVPTN